MSPTIPGLFAILGQSDFEQLGNAIKQRYPTDYYSLTPGQWLLSVPGKTTKEIAEELGISATPSIGSAVVVSFTNYYGRANPQIWEWIAARLGGHRG